jgi:hypothetical protein
VTWHRHIWRVVHVDPSLIERIISDDSQRTRLNYSGRHLTDKTVTYECEKCGTQKVERT